jgi:hypothetical protein
MYEVRIGSGFELDSCSANVSACGDDGDEEHFDVAIVTCSVSEVRDVRVEIIDVLEPWRTLSK